MSLFLAKRKIFIDIYECEDIIDTVSRPKLKRQKALLGTSKICSIKHFWEGTAPPEVLVNRIRAKNNANSG